MIENHLVDKIHCLDHNAVVLDLRAENDNCVTHVIINQKMARKLSESLRKWAEGGSNENS